MASWIQDAEAPQTSSALSISATDFLAVLGLDGVQLSETGGGLFLVEQITRGHWG